MGKLPIIAIIGSLGFLRAVLLPLLFFSKGVFFVGGWWSSQALMSQPGLPSALFFMRVFTGEFNPPTQAGLRARARPRARAKQNNH